MSRGAPADAGGGGRVAFSALLVVLVAVAMMLLVRAQPHAQPFDPRSGADDGARGLVILLRQYGADVEVVRSVPTPGADRRVLVLQDRLNQDQRRDLRSFADAGGVVVMADPDSPLAGDRSATTIDGSEVVLGNDLSQQVNVPAGTCTIGSMAHLRGLYVYEGVELRVGPGESSCFGSRSTAFAVARPRAEGVVVALGDNKLFTNRYLRFADNAALATALLAPTSGSRLSIVLGAEAPKTVADIGTGDKSLSDLVRPGVWMAVTQLAIAFLVFALAKAIRPGRPVREPEQVPVAGSELVVATGSLMHRARHAQRAGWLLRGNLFRALCERFRLPSSTSIESLDAAVSARTDLAPGRISAVLHRDVSDHHELLQLSNSLQEIRDLVLEGAHHD